MLISWHTNVNGATSIHFVCIKLINSIFTVIFSIVFLFRPCVFIIRGCALTETKRKRAVNQINKKKHAWTPSISELCALNAVLHGIDFCDPPSGVGGCSKVRRQKKGVESYQLSSRPMGSCVCGYVSVGFLCSATTRNLSSAGEGSSIKAAPASLTVV